MVSDQSYTAEHVSTSIEDKTRIYPHTAEMHSWENLWETTDVVTYDGDKEEQGYVQEAVEEDDKESRVTESDLDKLGFRDGVLLEERDANGVGSNEFGEDGPENKVDFLENEEQDERSEGREAEQVIDLNQNSEVVHHWAQMEQIKALIQRELEPHNSKEQEESTTYTVKGKEDESRGVSEGEWKNYDLADDGEMTWYFTWR